MKSTTSISISTEVLDRAREWARDERRNFSGHVEVLLEAALNARRRRVSAATDSASRRTTRRKGKEAA